MSAIETRLHPVHSHLTCYSDGRIFSSKSESFLKGEISDNGYLRVLASSKRKRPAHRLIIEAFRGPSELQVNHIDGNKLNNSISNLEYVTASENKLHAWRTGLQKPKYGASNPMSRHDEIQVLTAITFLNAGFEISQLASFGYIKEGTLRSISCNRAWPHLGYLKSCRKNRRKYLDAERNAS